MSIFNENEGLTAFAEKVIDIAQQIAPELAQHPVYVIRARMKNLRGCNGPGFDEMFGDEIRAAGRWEGRGACVAVDDATTYREHFAAGTEAGMDVSHADAFSRRGVAGVMFHEFAHAIRDDEMGTSAPIGGEGPDACAGNF